MLTTENSSQISTDTASIQTLQAPANPNSNLILNKPWNFTDFNGDGKSDIFWHDPKTGANSIWLMDGTTITSKASLQQLDASWNFSLGDYNGDGKTDFFWRNSQIPPSSIWLMDGTTIADRNTEQDANITFGLPQNFAIGDFNGDGKSDIFWPNPPTSMLPGSIMWLMDGKTKTETFNLPKIDSSWTPIVGDFNGDGKSDMFWRNSTTGDNGFWLMNGSTITTEVNKPEWKLDPTWTPSIADFNGDGKSDIFWRNSSTGDNAIWTMDGTSAVGAFLPKLDPTWTPSIADFNGDGKTDIFWRNSVSGQNAIWTMDGSNATGTFMPQLDIAWTPSIGDFDGDGKTDILWRNQNNGQNAVWTMDGINAVGSFIDSQDPSLSAFI